ncbi:MAG TPA: radical SAM protein, partial [Candidatus Hydrogenedentes bacterium]|nr:radical SAM protein [Candidatus Hydrogenedentota bacterium]
MRVAFLNPMFGKDFTKSARWFARSRGRVQRHPDYLCTAAATVRAAGHEVYLVDAQAKNLPTEDLLPALRDFAPDLIVYQASTPSIDADIRAAALCKEATGVLNVMVGSHVSAEPEDTLRRAGGAVDAVAVGEYDYTLRDLADGVAPADCLGLACLREGACVCNAPRPFIEDLDALPYPAWDFIDIEDYYDAGKLFPFLTLVSGRGCWGQCTFCQLPQVMNGRAYRARSVESVIGEIEHDRQLFPELREVMFEDDTLVAQRSRERLAALCEALIRADFGIAWSANARVDCNDLTLLRLMKRSGCRMLCVGFEFGTQAMLDNVRKGTTIEQMHAFAENASKARIRVHGCFMFGGPGETMETARETIRLSQRLPIDTAQFSGMVAYPGTEFYEWAKREGLLIPGDWREWVDEDFEQCATVRCPTLTTDEINALIDEGLRCF